MASHDGIYYSTKKKGSCSQYFVKEARYHPNGFTVYKVISRVPDPSSLDCFKECFVWKRYSDFRDLYKCLATLHRKLYLNGQVPVFAKPKLFGRFDDCVIEERRESAELVLKFATEHPALLRSAVFKEFFQGLQPVDSTSEIKYLKQAPLKPNVRQERKSLECDPADLNSVEERLESGISGQDLELFDPFYSTKDFINSTSTDQDETWINQIKQSFSTSEEGEVNTTSDTGDTYQSRELDSDDEVELLKALEVSIGQVDLQSYHKRLTEQADQNSASRICDHDIDISGTVSSGNKRLTNMDPDRLYQDENARDKHRKSSKASAYLEAVIKQNKLNSESNSTKNSNPGTDQTVECNPIRRDSLTTEEKAGSLLSSKSGLPKTSSLLDLPKLLGNEGGDDDSSGGYVIQAAQQISFARSAEIKLCYEEAFGHYKTAINTLLQGVQGDTNEKRIGVVRKKTANYLKRAEDIYSCYLKSDGSQDFWNPDVKSSSPRPQTLSSTDVQRTRQDNASPGPYVGSPRHNSKELLAYKVLGTIGKVLLVLDTRSNETCAMKIMAKSSQSRIRKGVIPTNVPYMVRLHRYYSTDQAVCLVMEHASGGKLWDQLQPYFDLCKSKETNSKVQKNADESLRAHKNELCSTPKKKVSIVDHDAVDESAQSQSFLDVCMEYKTEDHDHVDREETTQTLKEEPTDHPHPSKPFPLQRTWSYLSWDDPVGDTEEAKQPYEMQTYDVFGNNVSITPIPETKAETISDFKRISSQGNMKLFTIDPDDDCDDGLPSIDNCESQSNGDISEEFDEKTDPKCMFPHELLSEQDLSAVSLISADDDEAILNDEGPELRSANLSLSRILHESKSSPSLSMNSSFEEDRRKNGVEKDTVTRIIDENGVSSVDARTVFRTLSRTKSTTSTENKTLEKPDIVKDILDEESENEPVRNNKIHSIFVGLDKAKKSCMAFRIPEYTVQRWAAEMIIAVGTLHSVSILCRDLNPNNILLSEDGHIRLSYFGKWRQVERKPCDKKAVSRLYVAPEMSQVHEKKTEACDWWSIGALLYELLTGRPLFEAHPAGINSHTILSLPDHISLEAKSLLTGLLQYFPTQRLGYGVKGLDDIMNHSFFDDTEWDILIEECSNS